MSVVFKLVKHRFSICYFLLQMVRYIVVEFLGEGSVSVVPLPWTGKDSEVRTLPVYTVTLYC